MFTQLAGMILRGVRAFEDAVQEPEQQGEVHCVDDHEGRPDGSSTQADTRQALQGDAAMCCCITLYVFVAKYEGSMKKGT